MLEREILRKSTLNAKKTVVLLWKRNFFQYLFEDEYRVSKKKPTV